jgi:hypothetical protein
MSYATREEFVRTIRLDNPSEAALAAADRALDAAAQEIDVFLSWDVTPPGEGELTTEQLALVAQVNLDRAGEHWRATPFGTLNQGPDLVPVFVSRISFYRHAQNLASLKADWGVA